jgi:hypothetical protein
VCRESRGPETMNTLFDILRKDSKGGFHWIESVNNIQTAKVRLQELCADSRDEFVVFRNIDLRVVASCIDKTYRRL